MVQKAVSSPQVQDSPRRSRENSRTQSVVSELESIKTCSSVTTEVPSEVTLESGYETLTDVVCKGPLLYYKPRWFGESWKKYDAVLLTNGNFSWYKRGTDCSVLEGSLELKKIPNGLITLGSSTSQIPSEQQVRFPKDFKDFATAMAVGEPYASGEIFWFLCPSLDMTRVWEKGFREVAHQDKFSAGSAVYSSWKKYSPERPTQRQTDPAKEGFNGVEAAVVLALDFSIAADGGACGD